MITIRFIVPKDWPAVCEIYAKESATGDATLEQVHLS